MNPRYEPLFTCAVIALAGGIAGGTASALLTHALHESLDVEFALSSGGIGSDYGGPSTLLFLLWATAGYLIGLLAESRLGSKGHLAMALVGGGAMSAFLTDLARMAAMTPGVPVFLIGIKGVCAIGWVAAGAARVYVR